MYINITARIVKYVNLPQVYIHIPGDMPQISKQFLRVPFGQDVTIFIRARVMITTDGLRDYAPNRRQCYFENERYLRFFKFYSYVNCEVECLTNHTLATCGCVRFSMPRSPATPVCGISKLECCAEAKKNLFKQKFEEEKASDERGKRKSKCDCLPSCSGIEYDTEISQAELDTRSLLKAYGGLETLSEG